jgi:hypothetical protein
MAYNPTSKKERQTRFLAEYIGSGGLRTAAAKRAQVPPRTMLRWFKNDLEFQAKIRDEVFPKLESVLLMEATRRAMNGSDSLLQFLLKAVNPSRYDTQVRVQTEAENREKQQDQMLESTMTPDEILEVYRADPYYSKILTPQSACT